MIHLQEAGSRNHLDDPQMPAGVELHAKGLQQLRFGGRDIHAILGASRHEKDLICMKQTRGSEQAKKEGAQFHRR